MTAFQAVRTRRSTSPEPLRHAVRSWTRRAPGRSTVEAMCGAQVAIIVGDWEPDHARACRQCRALTEAVSGP